MIRAAHGITFREVSQRLETPICKRGSPFSAEQAAQPFDPSFSQTGVTNHLPRHSIRQADAQGSEIEIAKPLAISPRV
ncbi:hypothetical protein [Sphingomonas sp. LH128]|jgi:hypothetical protein|uniref:hypothetical protein n=1 Tax=Sphingomonas sp. LH128 TaxID=473781 RepID=UPI0002D7FAC7|nr:hypothetical protein [Sphingomonas sp. LH128]